MVCLEGESERERGGEGSGGEGREEGGEGRGRGEKREGGREGGRGEKREGGREGGREGMYLVCSLQTQPIIVDTSYKISY